jgi:hypothetical protein
MVRRPAADSATAHLIAWACTRSEVLLRKRRHTVGPDEIEVAITAAPYSMAAASTPNAA